MPSHKDLFYHSARLHSGEAEVEPGAAEGEAFVVEAEALEDGGLEIGDLRFVLDDVEAHFIGGSVGDPALIPPPASQVVKACG